MDSETNSKNEYIYLFEVDGEEYAVYGTSIKDAWKNMLDYVSDNLDNTYFSANSSITVEFIEEHDIVFPTPSNPVIPWEG